jgi:hypothetical protein
MKTFLLKDKKPIVKWSLVKDETYFEGEVPEGYSLAVSPSGNYIVIDVDLHGDKNGFDNIPINILNELNTSLNYKTKNNGRHYWFYYTGIEELANKTSNLGYDLRTSKGYAVWYYNEDIRNCLHLIKKTSINLNNWLEIWFSYK